MSLCVSDISTEDRGKVNLSHAHNTVAYCTKAPHIHIYMHGHSSSPEHQTPPSTGHPQSATHQQLQLDQSAASLRVAFNVFSPIGYFGAVIYTYRNCFSDRDLSCGLFVINSLIYITLKLSWPDFGRTCHQESMWELITLHKVSLILLHMKTSLKV